MRKYPVLNQMEQEDGEYYEEMLFKGKQLPKHSISMALLDEESFSLLSLFVHSTLTNFVTHGPWSGIANGSVLYVPPLASFIGELMALLLAFIMFRLDPARTKIPIESAESSRNLKHAVALAVLVTFAEVLRYISSNYLTLVNYQLTVHFEFLATAFFSTIIFGAAFSQFKIISISAMFLGVTMITIQLYPVGNAARAPFLGFGLAIISSFTFGFSTVRKSSSLLAATMIILGFIFSSFLSLCVTHSESFPFLGFILGAGISLIGALSFITTTGTANQLPFFSRKSQYFRKNLHNKTLLLFVGQAFVAGIFFLFVNTMTAPLAATFGLQPDIGTLQRQHDVIFRQTPFSKFIFGYDFSIAGKQLRLFKAAHELLEKDFVHSSTPKLDALKQILGDMDNQLFPWIVKPYHSSAEFRKSFVGSGIVICVNDKYFKEAFATLNMIREIHRCKLPVEVFFAGENELSLANRKALESIPFTTTKNIHNSFDDKLVSIFGYGIKPFALLASSFRNAILIDADVVFFQSPEQLLNSADYQISRALFFTDRVLIEGDLEDAQHYVKNLVPQPLSHKVINSPLFKGTSFHTQESGVVVIDKYARFFGIMTACFLNAGNVRIESYKHMHGDKETFWIGFEAVKDDYAFNKYPSGPIGLERSREDNQHELCSVQLVHIDQWQRPIWLNGGLFRNKNLQDHEIISPRQWLIGPGSWHFEAGYLACLRTDNEPQILTESEMLIFHSSVEILTKNQ